MKKILFATCLFLTQNFGFGQDQIELYSHLRWDKYPSFNIPFNSVSNSTITMKGKSWGTDINYLHSLKDKWFIKGGIGYYKYSFDNIEAFVPSFGTRNARFINFRGGPSSTFYYVCDQYWYHMISLTVGLEKWLMLNKTVDLVGGFDVLNYFTLSQLYKIPIGNDHTDYKTKNERYFGFGISTYAGIQKEVGRFQFGPALKVPIFNLWKQDSVFPFEQNSKSRNKWLNGIGLGITCKYSLTKNLQNE
jgi:hypothetical protein